MALRTSAATLINDTEPRSGRVRFLPEVERVLRNALIGVRVRAGRVDVAGVR